MAMGMRHAAKSPLPVINKAWRRITLGVIGTVVTYKVWTYNTRLTEEYESKSAPGSFTGETVAPVERKSKYQGAGHSALGRRGGDRFT